MGHFKFKWNHYILTRLLAVFLLIMFPIYMAGLGIYNWGLNTVRNELLDSMSSQVKFYMDNLEKEVQHIKALQQELINDADLHKIALRAEVIQEFDKFSSILRLHDRLKAIKHASRYIHDVTVHIPPLQRSLSAIDGINPIEHDKLDMLMSTVSQNESQLHNINHQLYLTSSYPLHAAFSNKITFMIEVQLSFSELHKGMGFLLDDASVGGSILTNPDQQFVIINSQASTEQPAVHRLIEAFLDQQSDRGKFIVDTDSYYFIHVDSNYLGMSLLRYTPDDQLFKDLHKYRNWFIVFTIASIFIVTLFAFVAHRWVHKPLSHIVRAFDRVRKGDLEFAIKRHFSGEFGYIYERFNEMVGQLRDSFEQVYSHKLLMQRAELKQLQYQINPHFLYNSFFMLHRMIKMNDPNSIALSKHLGKYFQYITRNAAEEVTLEDEVMYARIYCDIQALRFNRRLEIEFPEVPDGCRNLQVPRLIIQPIIENAIEHGLRNKEKDGFVQISFVPFENGIYIRVRDNGEPMSDEKFNSLQNYLAREDEHGEITGLMNIHRRLKLKYGNESGLYPTRLDEGGLQVEIRIITH